MHVALLAFFLVYFPFTHMTHAYMKYFTWHQVRWNDSPAIHDPHAAETLAVNLQRKTSWAAPHIAAGGTATWSEVVADTPETERANVLKVSDIASKAGQLTQVPPQSLVPLPAPYDRVADLPSRKVLNQNVLDRIDTSLDGFSALGLSRPQTPEEKSAISSRASSPALRSC